ncbi:hypothetical protein LOK49_LG08G00629 [Camellia lanceoleosa]|uniref:Uncharacterized protein n=1 Tax=Camellia lanceoleosa TaxID=1840588 RepID=A0ACC0GNM9_9ERIC|nr:hypothetical protein LOK49_LG08G00629 [Camellia lanceoleosa]
MLSLFVFWPKNKDLLIIVYVVSGIMPRSSSCNQFSKTTGCFLGTMLKSCACTYSSDFKGSESLNGTEGTNSAKVVDGGLKGERGRLNSDEVQAPDTTPQIIPEMAKISPMLNGHPQITERELTSANDGNVVEDLMQNHDVFLSTLRSHLTKL